ncbi:MAG: hypothetical protein HYY17_14215 [Planctomycetes bacterium]|nr:hypothetical protein [Planctomycetota bacterium]
MAASQHEKFYAALSRDEQVLLELRDDLYSRSWEQMLQDLRARLKGKPYIFKLVNRIQDDIARIERLMEYEKKHHVNLGEFSKKKEGR